MPGTPRSTFPRKAVNINEQTPRKKKKKQSKMMEVLSSNALSLGKCSSKSIWTEGENRGEKKMFCFIGKTDSKQVSD